MRTREAAQKHSGRADARVDGEANKTHLCLRKPSFGVSIRTNTAGKPKHLALTIGGVLFEVERGTYNGVYIEEPLKFIDDAIAQLQHAREAVLRELHTITIP